MGGVIRGGGDETGTGNPGNPGNPWLVLEALICPDSGEAGVGLGSDAVPLTGPPPKCPGSCDMCIPVRYAGAAANAPTAPGMAMCSLKPSTCGGGNPRFPGSGV